VNSAIGGQNLKGWLCTLAVAVAIAVAGLGSASSCRAQDTSTPDAAASEPSLVSPAPPAPATQETTSNDQSQTAPPPPAANTGERDLAAASQLAGRPIEDVRIVGNTQVSSVVILQLVRTHVGDKFDPSTVVGDYQRIYDRMKIFANVEARVQPTATGVIVIFVVTEQRQIHDIRYEGNNHLTTKQLEDVIDLKRGQAIDDFRVDVSLQSIQNLYRDKNYPFAHISVDPEELVRHGDVVFRIVEGPEVTVRKVDFIGNNTFGAWRLKQEIHQATYIFILNPGKFNPEVVEEDVAALQRFYQNKGFWDVRIGRKITRSADMSEMQVTYLIDEGQRYYIDEVEFKGIRSVSEGQLRKNLLEVEGKAYDKDAIELDKKEMVRVYSSVGGFIYESQPGIEPNQDYLQIEDDKVFGDTPGRLRLVYNIHEGKQFRLGRILVKGNTNTRDNVILREMRMRPGQEYNSAEVDDAADRLRGTPYFQTVTVTPVGDDPETRDLLVEVEEAHTAQVSAGVGINSNGGFGGQLTYEQKNFDLTNFPNTPLAAFSNRAFTGAGQDFIASFSPGTQGTDADIGFTEPYLFDQPYSLGTDVYLRDRIREVYDDDRIGSRVSIGEHFNYVYAADVYVRAEDVDIKDLQTPVELRAPEIIDGQGHHTLTSAGFDFVRDTTNHGPITFRGSDEVFGIQQGRALGGTVNFTRLTNTFNDYQEVSEDLLGRRSVINTHVEAGWDPVDAPFYERFYGGGYGSIRGFDFRGVSPRSGPQNDPIGGDFFVTGGVEYDFPLIEDMLRGDIFFDAGDVEPNMRFGTIRTSVGFGFRVVLPFLGQRPLAIDFGFPLSQNSQDRTQVISFSIGFFR